MLPNLHSFRETNNLQKLQQKHLLCTTRLLEKYRQDKSTYVFSFQKILNKWNYNVKMNNIPWKLLTSKVVNYNHPLKCS